jgi:SH3-like domain-containing protein
MKNKLICILFAISYSIYFVACYTPPSASPSRVTPPAPVNRDIIFSFEGPQNTSVMIYRGGQLQRTITSGNTARLTVPEGSHTLEAQLSSSGNVRVNPTRSQLTVNVRGGNVNVNIVARMLPSGLTITDFSVRDTTTRAGNVSPANLPTLSVAFVNVDWLNVRSSAENRGNANRIDTISRNTRVEIIERVRGTNWVRIRYGNGRIGFVDSSFLSSTTSTVARPNAPTGLNATSITSTTCTLRWNAVSGATGYRVYWSSSSSGTFVRVADTTTSPTMNISNMAPSSNNFFRVTAFNSTGESVQSPHILVTTRAR